MSQHVPETCNESNGSWLPLIEYSVKSGVSLSTIRRKIKSNSITYRLEKGKYLILFNGNDGGRPSAQVPQLHVPTLVQSRNPSTRSSTDEMPVVKFSATVPQVQRNRGFDEDNDTIHMVTEAFEHALKEKEERIKLLERRNRELEDRLNELRLLVQVLEEKYEVRY